MAKNDLSKYTPEIAPFAGGDILHKDPMEFSPGEAVLAYAVCQYIEKRAKDRKVELKPRIMNAEAIIDHGTKTAGGGTTTNVRGSTVTRVKKVVKFKDVDKLKALLKERGLEDTEAFDEKRVVTRTLTVNPSKIANLVELGHLTEEEVESLHATDWQLRIKAAKDITKLLEATEEKATRKTIFESKDAF